jgi:F420-0:gamma-glutamyl ligase
MIITPIKTKKLIPPCDDLFSAMCAAIKKIPERSILVVTSKVVSIHEGRCIAIGTVSDKDDLIKAEADYYLPRDKKTPWVIHTILHNTLIPTAGIDESNANGFYILWPKDPKLSARVIYTWIRKTYGVKNIGIVITDSRSGLLHRGVLGFSLAHYGFASLNDYRGKRDLFGRTFSVSQTNVADGLAAAAVLTMGEGVEQTPLALITDVKFVKFQSRPYQSKKDFSSFEVPLKENLYAPFFARMKWRKGGGGEYVIKKKI